MKLPVPVACLALLFPAFASAAPATSNVRGASYPAVSADGSMTFRFVAPTAQKVQVQPGGAGGEPSGSGKGPFDLTRDKDGVWSVTLPPGVPGFHYYWLLVDGVQVNDPSSETYFGYNKETSGIEVPEAGVDFYLPKPVPHGQIQTHWYYSKITQAWRKAYVYEPPGYDKSRARYPVLYLRHGGGENVEGWVNQGHVNWIMDNLLAEKKIKPMLVVMDNGYANRPGEPDLAPGADYTAQTAVVQVTMKELLPAIDANFRTLPDRDHRAMAGLSMGARQTLAIGMSNLDRFSWIGAFSRGAVPNFDPNTAFDGVMKTPASFNKRVHLLWFSAGTAEHEIHDSAKATHEALDKAGVKNVWFEIQGPAHEWQNWRKALYGFAPLLFK